MTRLRILLVEDDAVISALLAELLTGVGHAICGTATTETEAVAAALRHAPDLMIVDVRLRDGNGVSAVETILRRSAMPHVFITGGMHRTFPNRCDRAAQAFWQGKPHGGTGQRNGAVCDACTRQNLGRAASC